MNFPLTYSETHGSGSGTFGYDPDTSASALLVIVNRWHECNRPGEYLVTIGWSNFWENVRCVADDFGNLIALKL